MSALSVAIDLAAISANVEELRRRAGRAEVMAVVKADAYGHGLVEASRAARDGGATWLGVAQPGEALALRAADDSGRVLTWLYGPEVPARALVESGVDVSAGSIPALEAILAGARDAGMPARVHLAVDTGLGREGFARADWALAIDALAAAIRDGRAEAVGIWSHLAWADAPGHATVDRQADAFSEAIAAAEAVGLDVPLRHLANSAATLTRPDLHHTLVRPGIAVYGLPPVPDPDGVNFGLRPAMSVETTVAQVKRVPKGQGVSYGHDYVTERETVLGLIPAGYADGVFRSAGGVGEVAIAGERYRIAGRVCMDQFVVDLGPDSRVRAGDRAVLVGPDGPSAREWGDWSGTIDYEVVCRFGGLRAKAGAA